MFFKCIFKFLFTYLRFCAFAWLHCCAFLCVWCISVLFCAFGAFRCFFVRVKYFHKKKKRFETVLMTLFILLLGIPNLALGSLMKRWLMLQAVRFKASTVSALFKEKVLWVVLVPSPNLFHVFHGFVQNLTF